ncbi:MAG: hypothetical protein ACTIJ6_03520 [Leucobacter sp.]
MRITFHILTAAAGVAMALALAGCTSGTTAQNDSAATPNAESSDSTTSDSLQISTDTIGQIFSSIDFNPDAFDSSEEMFDSIYPGVSASPDCLAVLGIGAEDPDANVVFGPSIDRSLTAQVSSFLEPAGAYYATMSDHADACIADPQVTFSGNSVDATVERQEIQDTAFELTLTATISGSDVMVIADVTQFEENVVSVVGWDPNTNETNTPLATGMFVEELSSARIDRINGVE